MKEDETEEQKFARRLIRSYFVAINYEEEDRPDVLDNIVRISYATQKDLLEDYETVRDELDKAIKQIKEKK